MKAVRSLPSSFKTYTLSSLDPETIQSSSPTSRSDLRKKQRRKCVGSKESKRIDMKGRETKGTPSADLLVCFPSRAHLTLMPKPICSPARPSEPNKHHHKHHHYQQHQNQHHRHKHHHHFRKSSTRGGVGQASPMLRSKTKQMGTEISSEPTSPKVTCAGQIKVRHKNSACKSWQSVMEEIERIHNNRKHKKKSTWMESLGFKKEVMQFLTCLRSIRFDFRCFGSFPQADITTEDDEDEEEDEDQYHGTLVGDEGSDGSEASRTVFSKWFMVLQENQNNSFCKDERKENDTLCNEDQTRAVAPSVPPPNALLLMRCRSAAAKNSLEQKEEEEEEKDDDQDHGDKDEDRRQEKKGKNLKTLMEEEKTASKKESLTVMKYDTDFYKVSTDIATETWVVVGIRDTLSRSRSWKR